MINIHVPAKSAYFIGILFTLLFGVSFTAHASDVTLTASPTSVSIGEKITVSYAVATTSFRTSDTIIMVNTVTNTIVESERVGELRTGTKEFSTFKPGTYVFKYRAYLSRYPIFGTSNEVAVKIPSATLYTLSLNATTLQSGETLVVTYGGPAYAHQSSNRIVIVNTATNRVVTSQTLGNNPSGTKTFVLRDPGTYSVGYRLAVTGYPIIKTAGPVSVRLPSESLYTLSVNGTSLRSGEPLVVTYASPIFAHQTSDRIAVYDAVTKKLITSQSVGKSTSGTKTFELRNPGTYLVGYRMNITGYPVIKTVGPITVRIPEASLYTLTPSITTAELDQPITITYSSPAYAHQYGDDIILYDAVTNKQVDSETVGFSPTGTKTFRVSKTGSYYLGYRMSITGYPVVIKTPTISVVYVNTARIKNYPVRTGPVIAFGDSITYGRDASVGNDYVSLLSKRIGVPIINAGVNGDTTAEALTRLERDVLSKDPSLVIVFLGGNDFLQKTDTATIFTNLDTIVDRITQDGSAVLMLGYKNYFLVNYDTRYRNVAWEDGAAYTPNVMEGILGNLFRTTDLIHPRDNGHILIADRVEPYVRTLLNK